MALGDRVCPKSLEDGRPVRSGQRQRRASIPLPRRIGVANAARITSKQYLRDPNELREAVMDKVPHLYSVGSLFESAMGLKLTPRSGEDSRAQSL
jgi:hypothetical protein